VLQILYVKVELLLISLKKIIAPLKIFIFSAAEVRPACCRKSETAAAEKSDRPAAGSSSHPRSIPPHKSLGKNPKEISEKSCCCSFLLVVVGC
jgi:hypothetical protein